MSKYEFQTSTGSGAAAGAVRKAEPDYDDRPTDAECRGEAEQARIDGEREGSLGAIIDLCARLEDIDDTNESWEIQETIDRLYPRK